MWGKLDEPIITPWTAITACVALFFMLLGIVIGWVAL